MVVVVLAVVVASWRRTWRRIGGGWPTFFDGCLRGMPGEGFWCALRAWFGSVWFGLVRCGFVDRTQHW